MEMPKKGSIGVFDSGFGGINILKSITKNLPNYNYVYLGDTARTPYGTRSTEIIYQFSIQAVDFLFKHNCELIVIACNTASSDALRRIQKEYLPTHYPNKKVIGVLVPTAETTALKTTNKRVGVIATEGTVNSGAFVREIIKLDPKIKVFQKACPLLVPIIEAGEQKSEMATLALQYYLAPLLKKKIDTLVLGCTHYGILESKIKKIVGPEIQIISEARLIPEKLTDYLAQHPEIEKKLGKQKIMTFYSTDLTKKFATLGSQFFGEKITAHKAILE